MRAAAAWCVAFALAAPAAPARGADPAPVRHEISVTLEPDGRSIAGRDRVTFPGTAPGAAGVVRFLLHAGMAPAVEPPALLSEDTVLGGVAAYEVELPAGAQEVVFSWRGVIDHPLEQVGEEYARGQMATRGAITPDGVFLAPETFWYPLTLDDRVAFTLDVDLPERQHLERVRRPVDGL